MSLLRRITLLEAAQCRPDALSGAGLAVLLDHARHHPCPPRPDDGKPVTGLGQLLEEALQWQEEHPR